MRFPTCESAYENNTRHPKLIDAMFRLPHSDRAIAVGPHVLGKAPLPVVAVDDDMGPAGVAYHDRVDADYHIATGGDRTEWNDGRTYRNAGVDIVREADGAPFVDRFEARSEESRVGKECVSTC